MWRTRFQNRFQSLTDINNLSEERGKLMTAKIRNQGHWGIASVAGIVAAGAVTLLSPAPAHAGRLGLACTSDYSYVNKDNMPNSVANCQGMIDTAWPGLQNWSNWWNYSNYDYGWVDSEKSSRGYDYNSYDYTTRTYCSWWYCYTDPGLQVTGFSGRGSDDYGEPKGQPKFTNKSCNVQSDCAAVPRGWYKPGLCFSIPLPGGSSEGRCRWNRPSWVYTSSGNAYYGNRVNISGGRMCMGESPDSGGWHGCATNGGANLLLLDSNNALQPKMYATQWGPIFGGLHMLAGLMNITGDKFDEVLRFSNFGDQFNAVGGDSLAATTAWSQGMNANPQGDGTACPGAKYGADDGDYSIGGGFGMNGCGCQLAMVVDVDGTSSKARLDQETYGWLNDDGHDVNATATNYNYRYTCNYDIGLAGGTFTL